MFNIHKETKSKMKLICVILSSLSLALAAVETFEEKSVQELLRDTVVNTNVRDEVIQTWNKSEVEVGLEFPTGIVSQQCLQCICQVESTCRKIGCRMDAGSLSCGYFQIKKAYWIDCGKPGGDWKTCTDNKSCSSQCVQNYMKRYAKKHGCPLKCEGFAREQNGGPDGCHDRKTLKYWEKLQEIPGCHGVE